MYPLLMRQKLSTEPYVIFLGSCLCPACSLGQAEQGPPTPLRGTPSSPRDHELLIVKLAISLRQMGRT